MMTYDMVIKNGRIVTAEASIHADLAINGETIAAIGQGLNGQREIDAGGKLVIPGGIDGHVHMQMKLPNGFTSADTFYTGTVAAAYGGTTAIVDFAECLPDEPMLDALARRRAEADNQVVIDYGLHMTISPTEMPKLTQVTAAYDAGCATFKLYMAYGFYLDDGQLLRALDAVGKTGGLAVVHAENWKAITALVEANIAAGNTTPPYHPLSRPEILEGEAVGRVIDIANYVDAPIHIFHVGCEDSVQRIQAARAKGLPVTGETCPQYLALTDDVYQRDGVAGALNVCAPPLRSEYDRQAMWFALANDDLQIITTDHCPFVRADKQKGIDAGNFSAIPGGVPSIELRVPLAYSMGVRGGFFSENDWVRMVSSRPAKLFGFPNKGQLAVGYDADVVIFDPDAAWTVTLDALHENCDWSPYECMELTGKVVTTLRRGTVIVENGEFVGNAGDGRYIKRSLA
jgi:dihydropyrimidinase